MTLVALFVDPQGVYANRPDVDCWGKDRDARTCREKKPGVGHPPCQRWGKFATGGPSPGAKRKVVGDDDGCFAACHAYIKENGGVLEHPKDSKAWGAFGIAKPPAKGGWVSSGDGGWTCCVWQGHYGHFSGKATWLLAYGIKREDLPELKWGKASVPLHPAMVAKHGEKKARKIGNVAWVGGKDKTRIREATPPAFAEVLLSIARKAFRNEVKGGNDQ